jgi:hypothetical protein
MLSLTVMQGGVPDIYPNSKKRVTFKSFDATQKPIKQTGVMVLISLS